MHDPKGDLMRPKFLVLAATAGVLATSAGIASGHAPTPPLPQPHDFASRINNPWLPFPPGLVLIYRGIKDGHRAIDIETVTHKTEVIKGIKATVIYDRTYQWTGHRAQRRRYLAERTSDFYAQDKAGNVWYLGENTSELGPDGRVISTAGTWRTGVNGARAGIFIAAHPRIGTGGFQEFYPGHAEDRYRVLRLDAHARTPAAASRHALLTKETSALEPGVVDHKYYIRGIGEVIEQTVKGGNERFVLASFRRP
jgi:hypothetical protein